jgi:hypothetical protein
MLSDMERDVDDVQGRMSNVLKTIGKFLQTKSERKFEFFVAVVKLACHPCPLLVLPTGQCQTWTIIFLILVLIGVGIAAVT